MIDVITAGILIGALIKGVTRGLFMAVFSFAAFVIGLAAALKLSAVTAEWLEGSINVSARWLPILSFVLVFLLVALIVNRTGKLFETTFEGASLGWLNKIGGILFYAMLYILILSIALFYLEKTNVLSDQAISDSKTYPIISPWGPVAMEWFGELIPIFKNVFKDLGDFFDKLSTDLEPDPKA